MGTPAEDVLLTTTKEKENFYRLSRLLINGGTTVLRDVFDSKYAPLLLDSVLANPGISHILRSKKNKITNKQQRQALYPSPGKYGKSKDFDISLIALLLQNKNICGLPEPRDGWFEMPKDCDISLSADITRIRMLRNQVYGHVNADMEISEVEFPVLWTKISDILIRIEGSFSESKKKEWIAATQQLLTTPLTETDRQHVKELEQWCIQETEIKGKLWQMEVGMNKIKETLDELTESFHTQTNDNQPQACFKKHHNDLPLDHFCYDCKEKCCAKCARVSHHPHNVHAVDNHPELLTLRGKIQGEIFNTEMKLAQTDEEIQSQSNKLQDLVSRLDVIEKMLHSFVEKCVNEIRNQEKELVRDIERIRAQSAVDFNDIKSKLSNHQYEMRQTIECAHVLLEKGDALAICHEAAPLMQTLREQSSIELIFKPLFGEKKIFAPNTSFFDNLYSHGIGRIASVDPLKCTATGDGVDLSATIYLGLETTFTVSTSSAKGEIIHAPSEGISVAVHYKLEGKIRHGTFNQDVSSNLNDNHDGTYTISYVAMKTGTAFVSVKIVGEHIQGSPFEVKIVPRKYEAVRLLGRKGKGQGNFNGPWCAAENSKGDIYITDRDNNRVQVFSKEGSWKQSIGEFGSGDGQLIQPRGIAIDQQDDVIVVDNGNNRVQIFDKDGNFKLNFGGSGVEPGRFQNPYSVSFDDDENLIISDADNQRVQVFTPKGELVMVFGQGDITRSFYCIYHEGQYIVSDFESHCVKFFNKEGVFQHKIGRRGARNGQFDKWIRGLAIDKVGNLLVCDSFADRIQVFRPVGSSFEFLEKFGSVGDKLGQFQQPTTLTVLKNGRFVICEFHNSRVQIF